MDIWIFEDDYLFQNKLITLIDEYKKNGIKGTVFKNIRIVEHKHLETVEKLEMENSKQNLFIIDVDLKKNYTGFDLAKKIRSYDYESEIVFITSHVELMSNVFLLNLKVMDYIYKLDPVLNERVMSVLNLIEQNVALKGMDSKQPIKDNGYLVINSKDGVRKISVNKIIAIETDSLKRKVIIKTIEGDIETRKSLKESIEELPAHFIKSHRSIILNLDFVSEICIKNGYHQAVMITGDRFDISRNFLKEVTQNFTK